WVDMRGGWQMPYYASEQHALVPKKEGKGIVVLPHNIWDWRASFEHHHQFNTHLLGALEVFDNNWTSAREYLLKLANRSLESSSPFGYLVVQHEWQWVQEANRLAELEDYSRAIASLPCTFQTFSETAEWFKQNYPDNPDYIVDFFTPYDEKRVEWVWTKDFRITRYDGLYVVGYVDYNQQSLDLYLYSVADCDFQAGKSQTNHISTSLTFCIDDFGNVTSRAPAKGNRQNFMGTLSEYIYFQENSAVASPLLLLGLAALAGLVFAVYLCVRRKLFQLSSVKGKTCFARRAFSKETLILIFFFASSLRVILWFEHPRLIVAGDLRPPLNIDAFTVHAIYVWNEIDFGTPSVYLPRLLDPFNALTTIGCKFGFDIFGAQIFTLIIMYFLMSVLVYFFVKQLADGDVIVAVVASLFFNFNVFLINDREQTAVGFVSIILMVMPCLTAFTLAFRKNSKVLAAFSGVLLILTQGAFPNYRPFLLCLFGIFLTALYFLLSDGCKINLFFNKQKGIKLDVSVNAGSFKKLLGLSSIFLVSALLASIWIWVIIATNWSMLFSAHSRMTTPAFALNIRLHDIFRLIAHWAFYEDYGGHSYAPYADVYLHNPALIILTFLIPMLAFSSLLLKSKLRKLECYFALAGLVFFFFTAGFTKYFKDVYYAMTTNVPFLIAFRSPTNWIFFMLLSYSILLGALVSNVFHRLKRKALQFSVLVLVGLLFVATSFPLLTGDVTRNWLDPKVKGSTFPDSYVQLDKHLSNVYWALLVPKRDIYVIYNYSTGTLGCGNPYPFIFSKPIISGVGTEYLDPANSELINKLHELVLTKNATTIDVTRKGKVYASSCQDEAHDPAKAVDRNNLTRWSSETSVPQWLEVNWTQPQEIEGLKIYFEAALAKTYSVETWDGTGWVEHVKVENNSLTEREHVFTQPATTSRLRLCFTEASMWKSISIWELEVYKRVKFPSLTSRCLSVLSVGYLIVEKNIIMGANYDATEALARLAKNQDFVLVKEWDEVALYQNLNSLEKIYAAANLFNCENSSWNELYDYLAEVDWETLKHAVFVSKSDFNKLNLSTALPENFEWKENSPCKYVAHVNSSGPFFVVLQENFDARWKLKINGRTVAEPWHFKANMFANGWLINSTGNLKLEILFETQDTVAISVVVSFLLPAALMASNQIKRILKFVKNTALDRGVKIHKKIGSCRKDNRNARVREGLPV
ncbi:MAG: discoidin domain-containing protein, partial [Candidatus Bathyarchaeia archaeon]